MAGKSRDGAILGRAAAGGASCLASAERRQHGQFHQHQSLSLCPNSIPMSTTGLKVFDRVVGASFCSGRDPPRGVRACGGYPRAVQSAVSAMLESAVLRIWAPMEHAFPEKGSPG